MLGLTGSALEHKYTRGEIQCEGLDDASSWAEVKGQLEAIGHTPMQIEEVVGGRLYTGAPAPTPLYPPLNPPITDRTVRMPRQGLST